MVKKLIYLLFIVIALQLISCANELPPPGGDEDLIPPEVVQITPKPNSTNFTGKSIVIEFDDYIDRRSFTDALFISPKPKSEMEINYSGTSVEIFFPDGLEINKTYTFNIGKELKDVRRGNKLTQPIQFAISTGPQIDKGQLSGKVYAEEYTGIVILAYRLTSQKNTIDPQTDEADFITQVDENGNYKYFNLPDGNFRVLALKDEDRNQLLDENFEDIYVSIGDVEISQTTPVTGIDFMAENFGVIIGSNDFYTLLSADTMDFIYSSIKDNAKEITPDYTFYFYFKNNVISRQNISDNFTIRDTTSGETYQPVFNWINDSLLEVFPVNKFRYGSNLKIEINLLNTSLQYLYAKTFSVIEESSTGKVNGEVRNIIFPESSVYVRLYKNNNKFVYYSKLVDGSGIFNFNNVAEGEYTVFSFIDQNNDGVYFRGTVNPFKPSERFIVYSWDMKVRGTWSVDNVFIQF